MRRPHKSSPYERQGGALPVEAIRVGDRHRKDMGDIAGLAASMAELGSLQPIVVRNGLHGLPQKALYSWEPTAMIGIYRLDEIFWNKAAGKEARR